MWNGIVVSVQTFCVSADYHTSHKTGFRLGEEYPHVLSCILSFPKKTTISVRILYSVTMAWRTHRSLSSSCEDSTDFSTLDCFSSSFASFLGFFQFLANCDVFGELGQLWQFWKQVRVVPNVISPSLQIQSNSNIMHPLMTCDKELKLSFILTVTIRTNHHWRDPKA